MTGLWQLVVAQATKNYLPNPSFENYSAVGWSNYSTGSAAGSRLVVMANAAYGFWCYRLIKTSGTGNWGTTAAISDPGEFLTDSVATFSVWLKVPAGLTVTIEMTLTWDAGSDTQTLPVVGPAEGRYSITTGPILNTALSGVAAVYASSNSQYFYVDGAMVEKGAVVTTYCDGDQPGCVWNAAAHASASQRRSYSRAGGIIKNFDDYSFYVLDTPGAGMPALRNRMDALPLQDVSVFQDAEVTPRALTLIGTLIGTSRSDLHAKRRALLNLLKPDLGAEPEPVLLRYAGANKTLQLAAYFRDGLSFSRPNGFSEQIALRFDCADPFWRYDYAITVELDFAQTISGVNDIAERRNGAWQNTGGSQPNAAVRALARQPNGDFYAGGQFTAIGTIPNTAYIAHFQHEDTWTALGTGANGNVYALALAPNGDLYAGGAFTQMGGVANTNRIARWNGSAWSALGTGMNGDVWALAWDLDGTLLAVGDFTTAGGVAAVGIARWNGSAWAAVGASTVAGGRAVAVGLDGTIYVGGSFANFGGAAAADNIAQYPVGGPWAGMGASGASAAVSALVVTRNGDLWAGGLFTSIAGVTANYLAKWNRAAWEAAQEEPNAEVRALLDRSDGLWLGGTFGTLGGRSGGGGLGVYDGIGAVFADARSPSLYALAGDDDDVLVGFGASTNLDASVKTGVLVVGTRAAEPVLFVAATTSPPQLLWFENYTTGRRVYLNYLLREYEELTLDFRPDKRDVRSSAVGNAWRAVLRNSDFVSFRLLPGANDVVLYAYQQTSGAGVALQYVPAFWSADGED